MAGPSSPREPRPFSEEELGEARAVAERIAVEVTRLLGAVEPQYRNAFALARYLQIDRTSVQRLMSAVANVDEQTLAQAPGPKAMRGIIDAYAALGGDTAVVRGFHQAIQRFESFLTACAGHQRGFTDRLILTQHIDGARDETGSIGQTDTGSGDDARRRMFDAARELTGRWSDVRTQITLLRPSQTVPKARDVVRARGLIGHMQEADAVPLVFAYLFNPSAGAKSPYVSLRPRPDESLPNFLLDEFCSTNVQVSSMVKDGTLLQMFEPEKAGTKAPLDFVTASASFGAAPDPRFETPPIEEIWAEVEFPVRRLILDVYLHRDLARRCTQGADAHALRIADTSFVRQFHRRWMTRIGPSLTLSILGVGLAGSHSDAYARQRPLTETLFAAYDWDPEEFVGFRLENAYPIWRTSLRAHFTFNV